MVVDTGVSTYEPGPERAYERSTAAHNTVRMDGEEQAEIWASFRVGRRPHVGQIRGGRNGVFPFVSGEHDAYRRLGVVHARTILLHAPDTWIVADILQGSGSHRVESFLHFHPAVRVAALADFRETSAWPAPPPLDGGICRSVLSGSRLTVPASLTFSRAGMQSNSAIANLPQYFVGRGRGRLPTGMIHVFTPAGTPLPPIAADWPGKLIEMDGHKIPLG